METEPAKFRYNISDIVYNTWTTPITNPRIHLCVYSVNTNGKFPFLQYMLSSNIHNKLQLPTVVNCFANNAEIISYSKIYLTGLLQMPDSTDKMSFNGYFEYENEMYLFFDITQIKLNINEVYASSIVRLCLIDELLNHGHVCNIQIEPLVTRLFVNNYILNLLFNDVNVPYEIPVVAYVGKPTPEKVNFTHIFGESAKTKHAFLGPYYYFTNFSQAICQGGWSSTNAPEYLYNKLVTDTDKGRYIKGGIVRFALFIGKTKYIESDYKITIDNSEIKQSKLKDKTADYKYEMMTLTISDHDGIWANTYDSVCIGKFQLEDGGFVKNTPMLVVKEYEQQTPLSFHYINKHKLGETYDDAKSYAIL
jgi:hypothetical protein